MVQSLGKTIRHFLKMLTTELPNDPEITFRVIYPREMETHVYTHTQTPKTNHICVFEAALFIIGKKWTQYKCPSIDEWINKILLIGW